eukprot:CAMPEP_0117446140 /NCGR_PEP_ID=MMETSP0759-20121206/6171_1 /TAXON_ID=63605 /ORGANISM="Percolomonas cosmopolitus, Strain WS" /LENGTH=164 /DNA_ID=CAMNT_0005238365 /DNA_START=15 /DNA_END=509 /DNA_ORIENTATION=+
MTSLPRTQEQIDTQKDQLGACSWTFLHAFAAQFPQSPSVKQQVKARQFLRLFSEFYPCRYCAEDFQEYIEEYPPKTTNREDFSEWMCEAHNAVNDKLGKPTMDCKDIWKRWSAKHLGESTNGNFSLKHSTDDDDDCGFCPEEMKAFMKKNRETVQRGASSPSSL